MDGVCGNRNEVKKLNLLNMEINSALILPK